MRDVYMATKKDSRRQNFSFSRFGGIADEIRFEESLKRLRFKYRTLMVNKAKFDRKETKSTVLQQKVCHTIPPHKPSGHHGGFRDKKTFVDVTARNVVSKCLVHQISLNTEIRMKQWKNSELSLIGKAHSAKHLNVIPSTVDLGNDDSGKVGERMVKGGIIEMDETWSPFKKQASKDNWLDDLPESEEEDHLGVSETDNKSEDEDLEEG
ncbi:unnamed protein product [Lactuca saligna]|uniref:Uncharacterized protein n=1 Tax=Lactuca saligna TaxID=75948 RepID=A0AA35Z037_LACSI|nr:unnamed protein product [Lactuca saligna]